MSDSSPKEVSHSTTIRESSAELPDPPESATSLRDTQATPIVRESQAKALTDTDPKDSRASIPSLPSLSTPKTEGAPAVREVGSSRVSVPPSEPRASRTSFNQIELTSDRPARLQMIVALVLGLVLVAIPLYLWRRPRAESITVSTSGSAAAATVEPTSTAPLEPKAVVSDVKVISCQDPGPKKTAADQCDHVAELEKAVTKAVEESGACAPKDSGGGAVGFVADVSFKRHSVSVSTVKEKTTMKSGKTVSACQSAVKSKLGGLPFDTITHSHARYKIAVTGTYH